MKRHSISEEETLKISHEIRKHSMLLILPWVCYTFQEKPTPLNYNMLVCYNSHISLRLCACLCCSVLDFRKLLIETNCVVSPNNSITGTLEWVHGFLELGKYIFVEARIRIQNTHPRVAEDGLESSHWHIIYELWSIWGNQLDPHHVLMLDIKNQDR